MPGTVILEPLLVTITVCRMSSSPSLMPALSGITAIPTTVGAGGGGGCVTGVLGASGALGASLPQAVSQTATLSTAAARTGWITTRRILPPFGLESGPESVCNPAAPRQSEARRQPERPPIGRTGC